MARILIKLICSVFFKNVLRKLKFNYNFTRITGTLHEDVFTFLTIVILRMRNVLDKSRRENINTHFMFYNVFPKIVPFMR